MMWLKFLTRPVANQTAQPVQASEMPRRRRIGKSKLANFHLGAFVEALLVGFDASARAEPHLPIALRAAADRAAAIIAADAHGLKVQVFAGNARLVNLKVVISMAR